VGAGGAERFDPQQARERQHEADQENEESR